MHGSIFITGASSGFGASCARRFGKEGRPLILVARRVEKLEQLKKELDGQTAAYILSLDIRDRNAVQNAVASLPESFADIEILLNNAGIGLGVGKVQEGNLDDWDAMIDTNVKGLLYCTRAILPGMIARDRGHIINVGSIAGSWPYPEGNIYAATKAFVNHFSRLLKADLYGTKLRVTNIEPGLAETEFAKVRYKGDEEKAAEFYDGILETLAPEDIAETIYWVANMPQHVNVASVEVMPTAQNWGEFRLQKK